MRLIDADELIRRIAKWIYDPCGREETLEQMLVNDIGASVCMEIEEMPTAFDKEKVIGKLKYEEECAENAISKLEKDMRTDHNALMEARSLRRVAIAYYKSADIVEKGGIE